MTLAQKNRDDRRETVVAALPGWGGKVRPQPARLFDARGGVSIPRDPTAEAQAPVDGGAAQP